MYTNQERNGVDDYQALSESMQRKIFESLMKDVDIDDSFKIIDVGCGTGNHSSILSKKVASKGKVVGIDPIKERIALAEEMYGCHSPNLHFEEGSAVDCSKYGTDFDLAVSTNVLHFIPVHDRKDAFEGIFKCLKPGSVFVFASAASDNHNLSFLLKNISCYEQFSENYHPIPIDEAEKLLTKVGFKEVETKQVDVRLSMNDLDQFIRWVACSIHVESYAGILEKLREFCSSGVDLAPLYDEKGQVVYRHYDYYFGICKKL